MVFGFFQNRACFIVLFYRKTGDFPLIPRVLLRVSYSMYRRRPAFRKRVLVLATPVVDSSMHHRQHRHTDGYTDMWLHSCFIVAR